MRTCYGISIEKITFSMRNIRRVAREAEDYCKMNSISTIQALFNKYRYGIMIVLFFVALIWSGIRPYNRWNWFGEILPAVIGLVLLVRIYPHTRFTFFAYTIALIASLCIFLGGHYTYAKEPVFNWIKETYGLERNNFDKFGHFFQGMVPAILARELFYFKGLVNRKWIGFLAFCVAMTTTSVYEIIEYFVCLINQKPIESFMGIQGYLWDSQTDMLFAMLGSLFVLFVLKPLHIRWIEHEGHR
jgi:putative membrane protein